MIAVWKKELKAYFLSPVAYVFIGFFILVLGLFFTTTNLFSMSSSFVNTLSNMTFLFMLVIPILTMRLVSEERRNKTDQLLLTAPVSIMSVVLGKYLAAVSVFLITLILTAVYPIIISIYGQLATAEVLVGYFGLFLFGSALISIGVFISALTENQVTSAVSTFGVLFLLWLINSLTGSLDIPWLVFVLEWISVHNMFTSFTQGLLSLSPVVYYLCVCAIFVFLTVRAIEKRRWSEG